MTIVQKFSKLAQVAGLSTLLLTGCNKGNEELTKQIEDLTKKNAVLEDQVARAKGTAEGTEKTSKLIQDKLDATIKELATCNAKVAAMPPVSPASDTGKPMDATDAPKMDGKMMPKADDTKPADKAPEAPATDAPKADDAKMMPADKAPEAPAADAAKPEGK